MNIGTISLGCDKNRVDTEKMLARLTAGGHRIVSEAELADVLIVNTCAFIDKAKEESIDEILWAIEQKKGGHVKHVIITGCLAQRYADDLKAEFPEVDAILGVSSYDGIVSTIERISAGDKVLSTKCSDGFFEGRVLTTPYHYAYLKIAEGCNNHCTYCAIPSIRGRYRSESMEDLLSEAKTLSDDGVKELILVAQDVTRYGIDFDGKPHLIELVRRLEELDFEWIRLLYLEPEMVDDELIEFIANEPKVVKYMDIPFQHVDSEVLKRMNRHTDEQTTHDIVKKVKAAGITLRTTFICGFPGESEVAHKKLYDFVKSAGIDYAGFFAYSREEGTAADRLDGHLDEDIKQVRADELCALQNELIAARNKDMIGKRVRVIYDGIDYDRQMFQGRLSTQAPDIDNVVYFVSDGSVEIGNFYEVVIEDTDGVDLFGRVTE
ncbi:MAG: 30S ribosomal protein S12 methylthiotransferase RimO [Clostridia bacterium]|nr:30S ribosomal protein S12 methylthiotransferase RimO [Clostridia bacterium]